jgi:hypothetical protein
VGTVRFHYARQLNALRNGKHRKGRIGINSQNLVFWGHFRSAKKCQGAKMCSCSGRRDSACSSRHSIDDRLNPIAYRTRHIGTASDIQQDMRISQIGQVSNNLYFISNVCRASSAIRDALPRSPFLHSQVIGEVRTAPLKPYV